MRPHPLRFALSLGVLALLGGCVGVAPGTPRPTTAEKPNYDPAALERLVLGAANDARRRHRLDVLRPDAALTRAARRHSRDLARTGRFSHTGSDGSRGADRAAEAGARYRAFGENLFRSSLYAAGRVTRHPYGRVTRTYDWIAPEALAQDAVEAWLASPGHRANLLKPAFGRAGVGVALDPGSSPGQALGWIVTMDYAD